MTAAVATHPPASAAAGRRRRNMPIVPATGSHWNILFDQKFSRTFAMFP